MLGEMESITDETESSIPAKPLEVVCFSNEQADQLRFDLVNQGVDARIEMFENKPRLVKTGDVA